MRTLHRRDPHRLGLALLLLSGPVGLACNGTDFHVTGIDARLVASPGLTDFGTVLVGSEALAELTLSAADGEIEVLAMELVGTEGQYFSFGYSPLSTVTEDAPLSWTIGYAPEEVGYHWAELHITTDEPEEASLHVVQLRGQAAQGSVQAWPMVVDFGPVPTGQSETATLTLWNQGDLDLSLEGMATAGAAAAQFAAMDLPLSVPAGEQVDLSLRFTALDQDAATATGSLDFGGAAVLGDLSLRANACETADSTLYDQDADGVSWCADDCDDTDASVHPGAVEDCDGVDDDCDDLVDEGTSCYDDDGDGFTEDDGDCHDGDVDLSPAVDEVMANGIDDDCDGVIDDGATDSDHDGWADTAGDCEDGDDDIHPGATETANGIDDDGDGTTDEGTSAYDDDGDGDSEDDGDCDDTDRNIHAGATESANWLDDDCDGNVDEGTTNADDDGDGFSERGGDCDDGDPSRNPGEPETTGDGTDSDCDGRDS